MTTKSAITRLAKSIALQYAALPLVQAVALGGSRSGKAAEPGSDIDLYVYTSRSVPLSARRRIPPAGASKLELDNRFWEPGDEWIDPATGIRADVMFRPVRWIEGKLGDVLDRHQASIGYTTCLWHNVRYSIPLYDKGEWFKRLQRKARSPYPEPLVQAIVGKNFPILSERLSGYGLQIRQAARRGDLVSLNHRTAAFLASYFDVLFALNRKTHPGEKRLLDFAEAQCKNLPGNMRADVERLIRSVADGRESVKAFEALAAGLKALLERESSFPPSES
jgi:hypothetical protein